MIDYAKDLIKMPIDPSFADRLWFGLSVMLIGMGIVFSVLVLLWGILELFGFVSKKTGKKSAVPAQIPQNEIKAEDPVFENTEEESEKETVAAITAAISAVLEKPVSDFRVVSFRKRKNWNNL